MEFLQIFKEHLQGWRTLKGADYCPKCWEPFQRWIAERRQASIIINVEVYSTTYMIGARRFQRGFLTSCANCGLLVSIFPKRKEA